MVCILGFYVYSLSIPPALMLVFRVGMYKPAPIRPNVVVDIHIGDACIIRNINKNRSHIFWSQDRVLQVECLGWNAFLVEWYPHIECAHRVPNARRGQHATPAVTLAPEWQMAQSQPRRPGSVCCFPGVVILPMKRELLQESASNEMGQGKVLPLLLLIWKDESRKVTLTREVILGTAAETEETEAKGERVPVFGQRSMILKAGLPG